MQVQDSRQTKAMGRPKGSNDNHVEDDVYTYQVLGIISAYVQYTVDAGHLKWGFYTSDEPAELFDEVIDLQPYVQTGDHSCRMRNLILMTRRAMDLRAASEFESIYNQVYQNIKSGMSEEETIVNRLILDITNYADHFPFLTLSHAELLPHVYINNDILIPMRILLKEIVHRIRLHIFQLPN